MRVILLTELQYRSKIVSDSLCIFVISVRRGREVGARNVKGKKLQMSEEIRRDDYGKGR